MRSKMLPLGIDLGTTRARVAVAERYADGTVRVNAVASRDLPSADSSSERSHFIAILLEEMLAELNVRERRCVASIGPPSAIIRVVRFPKMSWTERLRAARFEAQQFAPWALMDSETSIRVHPHDRTTGAYAIGMARSQAVQNLTGALKAARLRTVALDYDALALRRALPAYDAIIDIGAERSTLHAYYDGTPTSMCLPVGGAGVTRGIAGDLSIDDTSAERRKRILGCAGAGGPARDRLVLELYEAIEAARTRAGISRIALVGNGGRLPGLASGLEKLSGAVVELPVPALLESDAYPDDVLRAAAPDWILAAALTSWSAA